MDKSPRASLESFRLDILSNALTALTEEIEITLLRSAYSQVVKEAQDASCAIFTAAGRIVAQPVVIPGHLGSMKFMLAEVLKDMPAATLNPGDVLVSNDPYRGGSHLPDIAVFRPIFFEQRLVGFAGCIVHYTDVGGMVPGSNPQRATELYQEGLVIPPSKLYEAGRLNVSLHGIIKANVRDPDIFFGDLRAQEAALLKGEQRVCDLVRRYGPDEVCRAMEGLIAHTEAQAKAAIRAIPNGVFEFVDFMDHDGIDLSRPIAFGSRRNPGREDQSRLHRHRCRSKGRSTRRWRRPGPRCFIACAAFCRTTSPLMTASPACWISLCRKARCSIRTTRRQSTRAR